MGFECEFNDDLTIRRFYLRLKKNQTNSLAPANCRGVTKANSTPGAFLAIRATPVGGAHGGNV